jgi:ABC-type transport system involved in Fe-S cluster assembly fused permease/ATPase subunit
MRIIAHERTVTIIPHRLAAVRERVAVDGTREELVRSGGRYAALWQFQVTI